MLGVDKIFSEVLTNAVLFKKNSSQKSMALSLDIYRFLRNLYSIVVHNIQLYILGESLS